MHDIASVIDPNLMPLVEGMQRVSAVGTPQSVERQIAAHVARHAPDEIFVVGAIHDQAARLNSFRIAAEAIANLPARAAAS